MKVLAVLGLLAVASALNVDSDLLTRLSRDGKADITIKLPSFDWSGVHVHDTMDRSARRWFVYDTLNKYAKESQAAFLSSRFAESYETRTFWIDNSIMIKDADLSFLANVDNYFVGVEEVFYSHREAARIPELLVESIEEVNVTELARRAEYGIEIIEAPAAWATTKGEGVVIAGIDTGVRATHEALRDSFKCNGQANQDYCFHDPRNSRNEAFDNNGHGTHTMGTIAGSEASGIGVAPNAKWIAAKGCASSSCSNADLQASFEWVVCPTPIGGGAPNCDEGADVVSNSWGGGRGSNAYLPWIEACLEAGMNVLFSQGNSGSSCSTANSPGDLAQVIGVGSTDSNDRLSSFSSRGPGLGSGNFPRQKPDISAPGSNVRSAYYTSDTAYASLSGTSMACPHAAGVVGLMKSVNPGLSDDKVRDILLGTADQGLGAPNGGSSSCDGVSYTDYPNFHYGYGRINAKNAVRSAFKTL